MKKPKVHKELDGLNLSVDSFGELKISLPIEKINEFLNLKVKDKKFDTKSGTVEK